MTNRHNRQARWIEKQIRNKKSPLYKWPVGKVEKGIKNLRDQQITADIETEYPLCYMDLRPEFRNILEDGVLETLLSKTVLLLGVAGDGKTPCQFILGFGASRYWLGFLNLSHQGPEVRTASNFDFFRLETGEVWRPDVFDDGDLSLQPFAKLKAFFDSSQRSAKTKERWGASCWVRNQLRLAADNKIDLKSEPSLQDSLLQHLRPISHTVFYQMIRPAFDKDALQGDIDAVVKRATVIVNTELKIYVRLPGEDHRTTVKEYVKPGPFLTDEADQILTHWIRTGINTRSADEFESLVKQEQAIFKDILDKAQAETKDKQSTESLLRDKQSSLDDSTTQAVKKIKRSSLDDPDVDDDDFDMLADLQDEIAKGHAMSSNPLAPVVADRSKVPMAPAIQLSENGQVAAADGVVSDRLEVIDKDALKDAFPNLKCVIKDPLHIQAAAQPVTPCTADHHDVEELNNIFMSKAKDAHGEVLDLRTPPLKKGRHKPCTNDLHDTQELQAILGALATQAHGEEIDLRSPLPASSGSPHISATQLWGPQASSAGAPLAPTQPWDGSQKKDAD